jgi:hypothetical protein
MNDGVLCSQPAAVLKQLRRLSIYLWLFRQKDGGDIPQRLAAVRNVISRLRKRRTTSTKQGGRSSFGRPNFTPHPNMLPRWEVHVNGELDEGLCAQQFTATATA